MAPSWGPERRRRIRSEYSAWGGRPTRGQVRSEHRPSLLGLTVNPPPVSAKSEAHTPPRWTSAPGGALPAPGQRLSPPGIPHRLAGSGLGGGGDLPAHSANSGALNHGRPRTAGIHSRPQRRREPRGPAKVLAAPARPPRLLSASLPARHLPGGILPSSLTPCPHTDPHTTK